MTPRRILGLAMVLLEAALVAHMFGTFVFPVLVGGIACLGVWGRVRISLTRNMRAIGVLAIALAVLLEWRLLLVSQDIPNVLFLDSLGYPVAQCFLLIQIASFFVREDDGRLPLTFPMLGSVVMAYSGNIVGEGAGLYQAAALTFVLLLALYLQADRARGVRHGRTRGVRRHLLTGAVLAAAILAASVAGLFLDTYGRRLDSYVANLALGVMRVPTLGFGGRAELGSMAKLKHRAGNETALRVYSEKTPGYLRGRAFDTYADKTWTVASSERGLRTVSAGPGLPEIPKRRKLFRLDQRTSPAWQTFSIHPQIRTRDALFAPLEAGAVALRTGTATLDDDRNLKVTGGDNRAGYEVFVPSDASALKETLPDALRERFTAVPPNLDPRIRDLAAEVLAGRDSTLAKVLAVTGYFGANYEYYLGVDIPPDADPLTYFLTQKPPAHCEFFAAGAAILLRLGGVPCRYVTGFVAGERNPIGGYWIARNRDAHAWVEAYDEEEGWILVEATPAQGVPAPADRPGRGFFSHVADIFRYVFERLLHAYRSGGWRGLLLDALQGALDALPRLITSIPGILLLAAGALLVARRAWRNRTKRVKVRPLPASVTQLHKLLTQADRALKRRGLVRPPTHTLHQFAAQIRAKASEEIPDAAQWYIDYAVARYRGPADDQTLSDLRARLPRGKGKGSGLEL